jgi:hypothetical protein
MAYRQYHAVTSWALSEARRMGLMSSWTYHLVRFLRALFRLAR